MKFEDFEGVHDWTDAEYFQCNAINHSSIDDALIDPMIFKKNHIDGERKRKTDEMNFGTIAHDLVLRGDSFFDKKYTTAPPPINERTGKPYGTDTKKFEAWVTPLKAMGLNPVTTHDREKALDLKRAMLKHRLGGPLLRNLHATEKGFLLESRVHGLRLKCKLDGLILNPNRFDGITIDDQVDAVLGECLGADWQSQFKAIIIDLKTTSEFDAWRRHSRKFKYYRAEWFYTNIVSQVLDGQVAMLFVVVDTSGLKRVKVRSYGDDDVLRGMEEAERALSIIYDCLESGNWSNPVNDEFAKEQLFAGMPGGQK